MMAPAILTKTSPESWLSSEEQSLTNLMMEVLRQETAKETSSATNASNLAICKPSVASSGESIFQKFSNALGFWECIGTPPWWLSVIKDGYALHFETKFMPNLNFESNRASAFRNSVFVDGEISKLIESGVIREVRYLVCLL